jgi:Family of unknown function (DUF5996)
MVNPFFLIPCGILMQSPPSARSRHVIIAPMNPFWPKLEYEAWQDTRATLHLWTQIAGKIRLVQTPWLNHSWHVPLYVNSRGLTTSPIPHGTRSFELQFDFIAQALDILVSDGSTRRIALRPQTVADFYAAVMAALAELGLPVTINENPCEIAGATPFSQDRAHGAYDPEYAQRFWQVLLQTDRVLKKFRTAFLGKASPVHFFWGSFDLAVTRFSGRRAPPMPDADSITREGYSHEVSSVGWWPGDAATPYPAFYAYAAPEPAGFGQAPVRPAAAFYDRETGQFRLKYDEVRRAASPRQVLLEFCQTTYEAAATLGRWARADLERPLG